jgi:predicted AAA+ superfamily ATPase
MDRQIAGVIEKQFMKYRQMVILLGPRQSGKTWLSRHLSLPTRYFSWDNPVQRRLIVENGTGLIEAAGLNQLTDQRPIIVFDELHKFSGWKDFLKGFYDTWEEHCHILVTGIASLDAFSRGGDSLMGRYFPWNCDPFSWAEVLASGELGSPTEEATAWDALMAFGGFPEPFLKRDVTFWRRWKNLRWKQLFREDLRDLSRSLETQRMEILGTLLLEQSGGQCNWTSLSNRLQVSQDTVRRWFSHLETLYALFAVRPWSRNVSRSLMKEPKVYFTDWSWVADAGARAENCVASQLRATIHFWQDQGLGDFGLWYLRDKDQREVDFLITKDDQPWIALEVKKSVTDLSPHLGYFSGQLGTRYNFQLVLDLPAVEANPFDRDASPLVVPARSFFRDWNP